MTRRAALALAAGALALLVAGPAAARSESPAAPAQDRIRAMVGREARNMGVPEPLALAVAHAESNFDPHAESDKGARGVMQIMPGTSIGEYGIHPDLLWDPRVNIRLGLHYLARLIERYRGRIDLALSFYNGGSAVGDLPDARVIPATAGYVRRVMGLRRTYEARVGVWGEDRLWTSIRQNPYSLMKVRATN